VLYFDHNATSPLCAAARTAWLEASERFIGNPSSPHRLGARAEAALDGARESLATRLGCEPREIVWTSGATESINMALHHLAELEGEALVSPVEHPCVLAAVRRYFGGRHRFLPVRGSGEFIIEELEKELGRKRPAFVAVMAANNETGAIQEWGNAAALCREHGAPFLCDAVQWLGKMPAGNLGGCDFVSGSAHKFGGPPGVGFLKCPAGTSPLLVGGKQEEGRRAGTENVAGVLSMIAALEVRDDAARNTGEVEKRHAWRRDFIKQLAASLPGVRIVGHANASIWNTVSVIMPDLDCRQRWVVKLDKLGFAVSTGSACSSGREETSHVLAAMGCTKEEASRALRFSSSWETTLDDWDNLRGGLVRAHKEISERRDGGGAEG